MRLVVLVTTTLAPSSPSATAQANPIPVALPAPVIRAVLPVRLKLAGRGKEVLVVVGNDAISFYLCILV